MTREEFYILTDILNSEVLGNFVHGGEASEVIAQFEEAVEKSGILKEESIISNVNTEPIGVPTGAVELANVPNKKEPKDKCKGCNNVKGCVTCVDGSEWAHYHDDEPVIEDIQKTGSLKSYEYYPEKKTVNSKGTGVFDANLPRRKAYLKGFKDGAHAHKELVANNPVSEDLEAYADECVASIKQLMTIVGNEDDNGIEEYLKQACIYGVNWQKKQMMKDAFVFEDKHNTACCLASECLRNHGWFNRESDFNDLWRFISGVNKLFEGEFRKDKKVKLIMIKEK